MLSKYSSRPFCIAFCLSAMFIFNSHSLFAQSYKDSSQRLNVVKVDITSGIFYSNTFNLSYERVVKKNQTIGLTVGKEEMPRLLSFFENEESSSTSTRKTATGYKLGLDYRFYLKKENRYASPHGVYIGPYMAYHDFKNSWNISITGNNGTQTGVADGRFKIFNAGFQAGYQFLINNRWTIDMTFIGASLSHYRAKMNVTGNFDIDDSDINQAIIDKLVEKFPLLGDLLGDGEVDQSGNLNNWGFGVRYMAHVGYAFGGSPKKKAKKTE